MFYTSATSLLLRLSPSGYGFPLSLPCRFLPLALSLLLSGGHPCPRHLFRSTPHTETEGGEEGDGAKERISEEGKHEGYSMILKTFVKSPGSCSRAAHTEISLLTSLSVAQ